MLLFADDVVLISDEEERLQRAMSEINKINKEYNMKIPTSKTKVMAFHRKCPTRTKIIIDYILINKYRISNNFAVM